MFAVYDTSGSTFRGTLEQLYEIDPVRRVTKTRTDSDARALTADEEQGPGTRDQAPARRSVAAYRKALDLRDERAPIYHVNQIMSHPVLTVRPETKLDEAWRTLRRNSIRVMPVQRADARVVGLLTLEGLLEKITIEDGHVRYAPDASVATVMSSPVITADPITDIRRIAKVLAEQNLVGIPVVNESDELVGVVTRGDILRKLANTPPLRLWG